MRQVAVFAGPAALPVATLALRYYYAHMPMTPLVLVAPGKTLGAAGDLPARFVPDEEIPGYAKVKAFLVQHESAWLRHGRSPAWYLQQYLKLAFLESNPEEEIFIADGDTVFSGALLQQVGQQPFRLTTGEKYPPYARLVRLLGLKPTASSGVANGGLFLRSLLPIAGSTADWFIAIMQDHVLTQLPDVDFSEYQIMAAAWENRLPERPLKLFRRFDLIAGAKDGEDLRKTMESALQHYDALAIEKSHTTSLGRRLAARLMYAAGYSW